MKRNCGCSTVCEIAGWSPHKIICYAGTHAVPLPKGLRRRRWRKTTATHNFPSALEGCCGSQLINGGKADKIINDYRKLVWALWKSKPCCQEQRISFHFLPPHKLPQFVLMTHLKWNNLSLIYDWCSQQNPWDASCISVNLTETKVQSTSSSIFHEEIWQNIYNCSKLQSNFTKACSAISLAHARATTMLPFKKLEMRAERTL